MLHNGSTYGTADYTAAPESRETLHTVPHTMAARPITVSSAFESGSIEVVDASDPSDILLKLVPEPHSQLEDATFMQWFHFSVSNAEGVPLKISITNAGDASFAAGWGETPVGPGYKAVCTYDKLDFFRVPGTSYDADAGTLTIEITPQQPTLWLSYFAPYPYQRHMELVTKIGATVSGSHSVIGQSLDGRDIDLLQIGSGAGAQIWVIAQQHPGEHMAEYWTEGLLDRLTDPSDPVSKKLLQNATFYVVPRINPDGCFRGHLRTNAGGANLNREWCDFVLTMMNFAFKMMNFALGATARRMTVRSTRRRLWSARRRSTTVRLEFRLTLDFLFD